MDNELSPTFETNLPNPQMIDGRGLAIGEIAISSLSRLLGLSMPKRTIRMNTSCSNRILFDITFEITGITTDN